jgi:glycosyltransferase involved in cell wall biosynthesis
MRISILTRSLTRGGAQVQVVALARGLARKGHEVSVVGFYCDGPLADVVRSDGINLVDLRKSRRWNVYLPFRRLVAHLTASRADIIYSFLALENLFGLAAAKALAKPIVWGIRGASVNRAQYGIASRLAYGLQFGLLRWADAIISNSHAAAAEIASPRLCNLYVVPNGIDVARYSADGAGRETWRRRNDIEPNVPLIGIVARLDPMKDHANFLGAAARVAREVRNAHFVVAGAGPSEYAQKLRELAAELGLGSRIRWLGEVEEPVDIYRSIDVMVSSSAYGEGFSNALGEAMACGTAVVATDIGDSRRIVGGHGRVVGARDPGVLAEAIIGTLADDSTEARLARRRWIAEQFGVDAMVARTEDILRRVARSSGSEEWPQVPVDRN